MPDPVIGYGSIATPFNEAFGRIIQVGWGGTVKWPTAPFSYLQKSGAASPLLTDSSTGTASFWFRVNGTMTPPGDGTEAVFPVVYVPGPRFFDTFVHVIDTSDDGTVTENVHDYGFYIWIHRSVPGKFGCVIQIERQPGDIQSVMSMDSMETESGPSSLDDDLCDNKWAHFLVTWDSAAGTGTLTVNKISRTVYYHNFAYDMTSIFPDDPSLPFESVDVPWTQTPGFFGARGLYSDVETPPAVATIGATPSLSENHLVSLAHVWVDQTNTITDATKFVTDNKPAALGPNGEFLIDDPESEDPDKKIPDPTTKPAYYFKGGPSAFVQNKGTGGTTALTGDPPISQSVPVVIGS